MSLAKIIAELPRLSKQDRLVVAAACAKLDGQAKVDPPAHLLGVIGHVIGQRINFTRFKNTTLDAEWRVNAPTVLSFIDETWPGVSKTTKHALLTLCVEMVVTDMRERDVPVMLGSVISNLANVVALFDAAFPGYRQAGMQMMLLKAMGVNRGEKPKAPRPHQT